MSNTHSLKYVKSAKASTDVPSTVRFLLSLVDIAMNPFALGSGIHLPTPSVVEWFPVCFDSCHCIFLEDMDFRSKLLPQDLASGEFISPLFTCITQLI
jgi:hypothetical protein